MDPEARFVGIVMGGMMVGGKSKSGFRALGLL